MSLTFHTDDTTTTPTQITVVEPPTIVGARLSIYPPKYAEKYRESINLQWGGGVMPTLPAGSVGITPPPHCRFMLSRYFSAYLGG